MATTRTSLTNPQIPQCNRKSYDYWVITMKVLFSSQDIWDLVENGFPKPTDATTYNALSQAERDQLTGNKKKDSKSLFYIFQEVHKSIFPSVAVAMKSKKAWDTLQTAYQGMEKVKTTKLQILRRDFETLCMKESDNIDSFFTHVSGMVTQIRSHGETLEERRIGEKVLKTLSARFDTIVVAIEETKDLSYFLLDELNVSLISHEHRLNRTTKSLLEDAFKTQVSFGQGRGRGRSSTRGRGRSRHIGGRSSPSSSSGRGNTQNPSQGPSQNQTQGQRKGMVKGLPLIEKPDNICEGCILGKQHRERFPAGNSIREKAPLEIAHSDLCGPMQTPSIGGRHYVLTFIDDYTRKTWVYLLKHKSQVFERFRQYKALVEKQCGHYIKVLRNDKGGKYISNEFLRFCREHGIHKQFTTRYTP
eukprot:PITA_23442